MTAIEIIKDLLDNPYPYDLMEIRREVEEGGYESEEEAKEDMDCYCTEEYLLKCREKYRIAQNNAKDFLKQHSS